MSQIKFLPYVEINGKYFDSQLLRDNSLVKKYIKKKNIT